MSRINVDCLMFPNSVFGGACLDSDDLVIFYKDVQSSSSAFIVLWKPCKLVDATRQSDHDRYHSVRHYKTDKIR